MKSFVASILFLLIIWQISGQNVGINNSDPQVSLYVTGDFAHRSEILVQYMSIYRKMEPFKNNICQ